MNVSINIIILLMWKYSGPSNVWKKADYVKMKGQIYYAVILVI